MEIGVRPLGVAIGARAPLFRGLGTDVAPRIVEAAREAALGARLTAVVPVVHVVRLGYLAVPVAQVTVRPTS